MRASVEEAGNAGPAASPVAPVEAEAAGPAASVEAKADRAGQLVARFDFATGSASCLFDDGYRHTRKLTQQNPAKGGGSPVLAMFEGMGQ